MSAPEAIVELVEKFERNKDLYTNPKVFDEENTKAEFINPFFEALGWDVHNKKGATPKYKEVVFEDTIKVGGKAKAPDYSFRLGGQRIFFVEAKKPSVNIDTDKNPAYQIRRYGWSTKLPLCILTDFEELAIYETTTRPDKNHNASIGRIKYYNYKDYVEKWDEIEDIFSKESVVTGKFDNFVSGNEGIKKGTSEIDDEFLKEIDRWRLLLARNIALRNKELTIEELNFAVQLTIDRIIFLRMAEDRGIEKYQQLKNLIEKSDKTKENSIYEGFIKICKKADLKYNSGLFHFTEEKGINLDADSITPNIQIDNKIFKSILEPMYYPDCPYEFSVISTEILGNVYERFLGKVIRLTHSHQAKVEEKPEVKKAGGVFYTPQYIVDYIIQNTIGELIKDKTPNQVSKMKFVDPACGSGSFLLGAYQYLLDWHLDYYSNLERTPKKLLMKDKDGYKEVHHDVIYTGKDGLTRLTINEKKRIVLNNIYGVDIDSSAVEVTKLSLLLKVLEDQNKDVVEQQQKLFQERALPYLGDNIQCGNSLIGTDILEQENLTMEEISKINPFDWEESFPEVFTNGGFDAVIGNPPYVNAKTLTEFIPKQREYLSNSEYYDCTYQKWDLYIPFIEKGLKLLKENGIWSMIIPYPFANQVYGKLMREKIINDYCLINFVDLSNEKIFSTATVTNCIPVISNKRPKSKIQISNINNEKIDQVLSKPIEDFAPKNKNNIWDISTTPKLDKDFSNFKTLGDYCFISKGMVLNADEKKAKGQFKKKDLISDIPSDIHIKEYIEGKNLIKYGINKIRYLEWDTKRVPSKISRPTFQELYNNKKIMINKIGSIKAIIDENNIYCDQTIRIAILWKDLKEVDNRSINNSVSRYSNYKRRELEEFSKNMELGYICCILNSNFCNYIIEIIRGIGNIDINPEYLKKIPIPPISLKSQQPFIDLADKMLKLNKDLANCRTPNEKRLLEKQIELTDKKINQLVYELYDLTNEEIAIVEENLSD